MPMKSVLRCVFSRTIALDLATYYYDYKDEQVAAADADQRCRPARRY